MRIIYGLTIIMVSLMTISIVQTSHSQYVETCEDPKLQKAIMPIDLDYKIDGGIVTNICKVEKANSVIVLVDAESNGQLTITIPKNIIYSLSSTDCAEDSDLMILMDDEEVLPVKSIHSKKDNAITVGFSQGTHAIEFVGFSIMPDPSPSQYCGIVMGFDSLYLPPKFQIERGMEAGQVKCNEDFSLLKKTSNGTPICVSFETGQKMLERKFAQTTVHTAPLESIQKPDPHQREITILAITPQNITLPESKNQTHKTKCDVDGICFTPE